MLGPLLEVAEAGPAGDAVVDDEEVAAFGFRGHEVRVTWLLLSASG